MIHVFNAKSSLVMGTQEKYPLVCFHSGGSLAFGGNTTLFICCQVVFFFSEVMDWCGKETNKRFLCSLETVIPILSEYILFCPGYLPQNCEVCFSLPSRRRIASASKQLQKFERVAAGRADGPAASA